MQSFKVSVVCAIGVCAMMAGCVGVREHRVHMAQTAAGIAPDNCDEKNKNDVNYIKIAYTSKGKPFADPDACHVRPGSTVIWLLSKDVGDEFKIKFNKDGDRTPDVEGNTEFPGKGPVNDAGRLIGDLKALIPVIKAIPQGAEPKFRYSIVSNGVEVDPSIIIDPN